MKRYFYVMAKLEDTQIIPFPLPHYLATYFANLLTTEPILMSDGSFAKPFNIKRNSDFGKLILRYLSKSSRPPEIKTGFTFFVKITDHQTKKNPSIVDGRRSFLHFKENDLQDITDLFKSIFEQHLIEHVTASNDAIKRILPEKERGIIKPAIRNFCKKYGVIFSDQNLEAWKKMIQRHNNKPKVNRIKVL